MSENVLYDNGSSRIREVDLTNQSYFPEALALDNGISLSMYRVNPDNGRMIDRAATVARSTEGITLSEDQQAHALATFRALYPDTTPSELGALVQYRAVTFLYPSSGDIDDLDLTFGIKQEGRRNGLAVNLDQPPITDQNTVMVLRRDGTTNVPLGVEPQQANGGGRFLYDNPDVRFDEHGNRIVASQQPAETSHALFFVIPGRTDETPEPAPTPAEWAGGWKRMVDRSSTAIALNAVTPAELSTNEVPPIPYVVDVTWAAVQCPPDVLADENLRLKIAGSF